MASLPSRPDAAVSPWYMTLASSPTGERNNRPSVRDSSRPSRGFDLSVDRGLWKSMRRSDETIGGVASRAGAPGQRDRPRGSLDTHKPLPWLCSHTRSWPVILSEAKFLRCDEVAARGIWSADCLRPPEEACAQHGRCVACVHSLQRLCAGELVHPAGHGATHPDGLSFRVSQLYNRRPRRVVARGGLRHCCTAQGTHA
jgi:hypothetical protein